MSDDFDFETPTGLPVELPRGERIMWQGAPAWLALSRHAFHADKIAGYFGLVIAWRLASSWYDGLPWLQIAASASTLALAAALALAVVLAVARYAARTSVYTLTTERLILRYGMVLPITLNIPLKQVAAAGVALRGDRTGDIVLTPTTGAGLTYPLLWPHARPWKLALPEPSLRCVADADQVGQLVGEALRNTATEAAPAIIRVRAVDAAYVDTPSHSANPQLVAAE